MRFILLFLLKPARSFRWLGAGQACSYGVVIVAAGLGVGLPEYAALLLGPALVVGLLVLGIAHGACDQRVLPAYGAVQRPNWAYLFWFILGYLSLAAGIGLVWWRWPAPSVGLFFGLTVWHWGSADAPAHPRRLVWMVHSVLRGTLLFALPAWRWPLESVQNVNGLLVLTGAAPIQSAGWQPQWFLGAVVVGHGVLWAYFAGQHTARRWRRDAGEVLLLTALFGALPPLLALGVYFVFWHSLQHILRLTPLLGYAAGPSRTWRAVGRELTFFGRRAWPMLLTGLGLLTVAYALAGRWLPPQDAWLGLAVLSASVITLPHALLVTFIMDASKWQARPHTAVLSSSAAA